MATPPMSRWSRAGQQVKLATRGFAAEVQRPLQDKELTATDGGIRVKAHELKLTAKGKALAKPFDKAILEPTLRAINKKLPVAEQVSGDERKELRRMQLAALAAIKSPAADETGDILLPQDFLEQGENIMEEIRSGVFASLPLEG